MNLTSKNLWAILLVALLFVTPLLYLRGFLCLEAFVSNMSYSIVSLAILLTVSFSKNAKLKRFSLDALIIFQLAFISILPVGMLIKSNQHGGFEFFLNERLYQYLYQEGMALVTLVLSSGFYAKERALPTGRLASNLLSPLSIAIVVRWFWMAVFETRQLRNFAATAPYLRVEYIVLVSLPLFLAILILTIRKNLAGYVFGFILGLAHIVLVSLMVIMRQNPGFGPIIVSLSSLAICIFSIKGMTEYHNKAKTTQRQKSAAHEAVQGR